MNYMEMWIRDSALARQQLETILRSVSDETRSIQVTRDIARATFPCRSLTSLDIPAANLNDFRDWTRQRGWEAGHVPGTHADENGPLLLTRLSPGAQHR